MWMLIPIIIFAVYWMQIFESFGAVGCEGDYALDLGWAAPAAYLWETGASIATSIVLALILRLKEKPPYWAPLVGVALEVASAIVTSILFQIGLAPMYERNARIARDEAPAETHIPLADLERRREARADDAVYLESSSDSTIVGTTDPTIGTPTTRLAPPTDAGGPRAERVPLPLGTEKALPNRGFSSSP